MLKERRVTSRKIEHVEPLQVDLKTSQSEGKNIRKMKSFLDGLCSVVYYSVHCALHSVGVKQEDVTRARQRTFSGDAALCLQSRGYSSLLWICPML